MGSGRRLAGAMAAMAAFALVAPANAALPTAPNRELNFLHVGSPNPANGLPQVVDTRGREVLLKGVNVDGIVDYWDADASHPPPPRDWVMAARSSRRATHHGAAEIPTRPRPPWGQGTGATTTGGRHTSGARV